ncbi:hypothetical protein [Allosphingosinicella sp.]|uniref:hypothetical protein n=1 Tax=Allosphingosinicella sp. TaxID=2823234 RepID=UPI002FC0BBF2
MGAARLLLILAAPLLFASCLLTPGKFVSTLDIKRDRAFTFTYAGEVIIADPGNAVTGGFAEAMRSETEGDGVDEQETAPSEETEATVAERRAIAEALSNEVGYRSAEYLGDGKFRVDYAISGRLDRGFVYPVNVDAEAVIPWIAVEVRKDGTARVKALAFGGEPGPPRPGDRPDKASLEREGTFTLTTDARLVMHNNEDGAEGSKVVWRVTPTSKTVPTAVVGFAD